MHLGTLHSGQFALFDFCVGQGHETMALVRVKAAKITPQIGIVRVKAAKVAPRIGLSPKCNHRIIPILRSGACRGGPSQNIAVDKVVTKFWRVRE